MQRCSGKYSDAYYGRFGRSEKMTSKKDRDTCKNILKGIRQIKRGEIGPELLFQHRIHANNLTRLGADSSAHEFSRW